MKEKQGTTQPSRNLSQSVPAIITAARTGDYAQTASLLNRFLQQLQQELAKGYITADGISKINYSLETLFSMQQMENWVAFADILEYEFLPLWLECTNTISST